MTRAVQLFAELGGAPLLQIDNPDPADYDDYGSTVAATANNEILVSARFLDNFAQNDGSVFVHSGVNGALLWSAANPTADPNGQFGISLASTPQGHVVVGAANDDHGAMNAGRLFVLDGSDGSLIKLIDNPEPDSNVNFGQGLAITPAGQIAVGAFGADGGFGKLYLFTSISVGESLDTLTSHAFNDANLQACVLNTAAGNGWATVNEVTALDCTSSDITDLTGLDNLTSLQTLDLTDNPGILCTDLDELETALPSTTITRPDPCSSGGGGVQASQVQALHNALGQRVSKTVNGATSSTLHFIYDQAGQVIAEIDATTGQTLREYIYVNGQQLAIVDDTGTAQEQTYFVHNDQLGTPQKNTDGSQAIVWNATYQPFGEAEVTTADIENNIRFPGQYADEETGLHYNYFRDYDPSLGRYVESDPIGLKGGVNTFAYVGNNSLKFTDVEGLKTITGIFCRTGCTLVGDTCGNCPKGLVISGTGTSLNSKSSAEKESMQNFDNMYRGLNCTCYGKRTVCNFVYRDDYTDKLKEFLSKPLKWMDYFLWLRNPSQSNDSPMLGGPRG